MSAEDHARYRDATGTAFSVGDGERELASLVLTHCSEAVPGSGYLNFELTFRGEAASALGQGSYLFEAEGFEATTIFIVPVGTSAGRIDYSASFAVLEG